MPFDCPFFWQNMTPKIRAWSRFIMVFKTNPKGCEGVMDFVEIRVKILDRLFCLLPEPKKGIKKSKAVRNVGGRRPSKDCGKPLAVFLGPSFPRPILFSCPRPRISLQGSPLQFLSLQPWSSCRHRDGLHHPLSLRT